ncbi:MAG: hypothetical protein E6Q59_09410 [Nitrosomonas sp.]|nr:MAG: hypothetical protein E6Q59_09410 [Nitrosomonas sp.]
MNNIERLEVCYKKFVKDLAKCLPDGMIDIDITLLQEYKLLNFEEELGQGEDDLTRYFHVIETDEKITLVNDQFAIWIVPENSNDVSKTFTFIALNNGKEPKLETAFYVTGVYNTSRLVLRVLEKLLKEIMENEEAMNQLKKAS